MSHSRRRKRKSNVFDAFFLRANHSPGKPPHALPKGTVSPEALCIIGTTRPRQSSVHILNLMALQPCLLRAFQPYPMCEEGPQGRVPYP